jgi:hypothetical protein
MVKSSRHLILTTQSFGMWRRVIWYIGTNASKRNVLSPSSKAFPLWRWREQSLSKQRYNLPCTRRHVPGTVSEVTSSNVTTLSTADILKITNIQVLKHLKINA